MELSNVNSIMRDYHYAYEIEKQKAAVKKILSWVDESNLIPSIIKNNYPTLNASYSEELKIIGIVAVLSALPKYYPWEAQQTTSQFFTEYIILEINKWLANKKVDTLKNK